MTVAFELDQVRYEEEQEIWAEIAREESETENSLQELFDELYRDDSIPYSYQPE